MDLSFSHHYQRRIDFNTDNLFHSAGMDFVCIPASRIGLTNPLPRAKIDPSSRDEHTVGDSMLMRQYTVKTLAGRQKL